MKHLFARAVIDHYDFLGLIFKVVNIRFIFQLRLVLKLFPDDSVYLSLVVHEGTWLLIIIVIIILNLIRVVFLIDLFYFVLYFNISHIFEIRLSHILRWRSHANRVTGMHWLWALKVLLRRKYILHMIWRLSTSSSTVIWIERLVWIYFSIHSTLEFLMIRKNASLFSIYSSKNIHRWLILLIILAWKLHRVSRLK